MSSQLPDHCRTALCASTMIATVYFTLFRELHWSIANYKTWFRHFGIEKLCLLRVCVLLDARPTKGITSKLQTYSVPQVDVKDVQGWRSVYYIWMAEQQWFILAGTRRPHLVVIQSKGSCSYYFRGKPKNIELTDLVQDIHRLAALHYCLTDYHRPKACWKKNTVSSSF